jgi:hypothetical protein
MIVKKVATSRTAPAKSRTVHVRDLCNYIAGIGDAGEGGRVEHRGSVNLLNLEHEQQVQEIADLAEVAGRSRQPVQHWIFSWPEGEQPTTAQADHAVRIFLAEMGLSGHQGFYALHRDTDNWHLHLAVNRVDPDTERLVTVNGGFDLEAAHRALARIEHAQGWAPERWGRYRVNPGGAVERAAPSRTPKAQPCGRVRDGETRSGKKSAQRIAIEEAGPVLRKARTWHEVHAGLAGRGMRVEAKGSGAIVWVGTTPVKASVVGRDCSMTALERRFGEYEGSPGSPDVEQKARVLCARVPGWASYDQERRRHRADKMAAQLDLRAKHNTEVMTMRQLQRAERMRIFDRDWVGKGQLLNATRSLLGAEHSKCRVAMQERHGRESAELRERLGRFPDFEDWLRRQSGHELAQRWRHREGLPPDPQEKHFQRRRQGEELGPILQGVSREDEPRSPSVLSADGPGSGEGERQAGTSYERHLADLLREPEASRREPSRIDLEIAVRMRVTGHRRTDIQRAMEERARAMRPAERRDWKEYARRTVASAFGVPGDRWIERLSPTRTRWLRVEGRPTDERTFGPPGPETDRDR